VSLADDEAVELLTLPAEFEGLPHAERLEAFGFAEAELPVEQLQAISQAIAERAVVLAAAHYLATTGTPNAQPDSMPPPRKGVNVGEAGHRGRWAGSPYGDRVAGILETHGIDEGGAGHRCGARSPSPAPA
jgi:hypothetical protein